MKEFICKKDYWIEDVLFAKVGDHVLLLPDNTTLVNSSDKQRVLRMPEIVDNVEYFAPTFEIKGVEAEPIIQDNVNHPSHYTWLKEKCGIEVLDITRHMDFNLGNAVKYILRAGRKREEGTLDYLKEIEDLRKAVFYIEDRITTIEMENNG